MQDSNHDRDAPAMANLRYADIGINLSDPTYRGRYHDKQSHPPDLTQVLSRASTAGVKKLMITGSDYTSSAAAIALANSHPTTCYATIGIHPCSSSHFKPDMLSSLRTLASSPGVVAFGEIGLDYDRLSLCPQESQLTSFRAQLSLATELQLPLFLHSRAAAADFTACLRPKLPSLPRGGLVHSFTGSADEMHELLGLGLQIGVNGCSLKTQENLDVVRQIPLDRLQLETDGPWCEMRPSHASAVFLGEEAAPKSPRAVKKEKWSEECMVKGRQEPCDIARVAYVVARVKGIGIEEVAQAAWANSVRMFGLGESVEE